MPELLVTDSQYQFVPPHEGRVWPRLLAAAMPWLLRRRFGVTEMEVRGAQSLTPLFEAGHGLLLAPNHCRIADAAVMQCLSRSLRQPLFMMASSHLFHGSWLRSFFLRRGGAFSVYREGIDRQAVVKAIEILVEARRPLVIFPEGALSQANERLNALMGGVSFMARTAARRIEQQPAGDPPQQKRQVFVVPVAIRYLFQGDLTRTVEPMLADIERRLTWRALDKLPLVERIYQVGPALLTLKEIEYLGEPQTGELDERLQRVIDHLLTPLEREWLDTADSSPETGSGRGSVVSRVKELRKAVLPNMIESDLDERELDRRWQQLQEMELAQQLSLYPARYVASRPSVDRILETVERFVEHLTGEEKPHPPQKVVVQIGDPIAVSGRRERGGEDPLLAGLEASLTTMLESLSTECRMYEPPAVDDDS